jgi:SAM-dependent methyltransferase
VHDLARAVVLDAGCGDAANTLRYLDGGSVVGIDGYGPSCRAAREAGLVVIQADLERDWPIADCSVDAVSANQVIEHVMDTDHFAQECYRVLRPGGVALISTENLAAWTNIAVLLLGQEPFSNSYSKRLWAVGNRLARRSGPLPDEAAAYPHRSVGSYQAVNDLFVHYGFRRTSSLGVHILPLPALALRWLRRIDVRHSMYITLLFQKPLPGGGSAVQTDAQAMMRRAA